jgi:uncharacterized protein (DUF1330 family)
MGLDITPDTLERFLEAGDGPVVLVNLVRLRPGGEDAYHRYGEAVAPLVARHGGQLVYAGSAQATLIGDETWDYAAVTRYPSRTALAGLVRDPEFEATTPLRHAALEDGILHAFTP